MDTPRANKVDNFDRDISGLIVHIDLINDSDWVSKIFAYVTESRRASNFLWINVKIHHEYDNLMKRIHKGKLKGLSKANLDDANHGISLPKGNQVMIFEESEYFLSVCKSIKFSSITFTRDIRLVKEKK